VRSLLAASYLALVLVLVGFLTYGQSGLSPDLSAEAERFNAARAMAHLHRIDELTGPAGRQVGSRSNALVRESVGRAVQQVGLQVYQQAFTDPLGGRMMNIIAQLPGTRGEAILLCGHHDLDRGGPGAVDGGAGLAVMLELARAASSGGSWKE